MKSGINIVSTFNLIAQLPLDARTVVDELKELPINACYESMIVYQNKDKTLYMFDGKEFRPLSNFIRGIMVVDKLEDVRDTDKFEGMIVYQISDKKYYTYNGEEFKDLFDRLVSKEMMGKPEGVASLNELGWIPWEQLPPELAVDGGGTGGSGDLKDYYTKGDVNTLLDMKSDIAHDHDKQYIKNEKGVIEFKHFSELLNKINTPFINGVIGISSNFVVDSKEMKLQVPSIRAIFSTTNLERTEPIVVDIEENTIDIPRPNSEGISTYNLYLNVDGTLSFDPYNPSPNVTSYIYLGKISVAKEIGMGNETPLVDFVFSPQLASSPMDLRNRSLLEKKLYPVNAKPFTDEIYTLVTSGYYVYSKGINFIKDKINPHITYRDPKTKIDFAYVGRKTKNQSPIFTNTIITDLYDAVEDENNLTKVPDGWLTIQVLFVTDSGKYFIRMPEDKIFQTSNEAKEYLKFYNPELFGLENFTNPVSAFLVRSNGTKDDWFEEVPIPQPILDRFSIKASTGADGSGSAVINPNDYYTKVEMTDILLKYYTREELDEILRGIGGGSNGDSYTKDEVNKILKYKSNIGHKHEISDVVGLDETLKELSPLGHKHKVDDVEGLKESLTNLENNKANSVHKHNIDDVVDLRDTLSNKADKGHTHEGLLVDKVIEHKHISDELNSIQSAYNTGFTSIDGQIRVDPFTMSVNLPKMEAVFSVSNALRKDYIRATYEAVNIALPKERGVYYLYALSNGNVEFSTIVPSVFNDKILVGSFVISVDM